MEVILLEYVDNLGTVGQKVRVKDGFARNYLLPQKLACLATEQNMNYYRTLIQAKQRKLARAKQAAETQAQMLGGLTLRFVRRSRDEEARLFGSVTNSDIATALEEKGFEIDRKKVALTEPIKRLGEYKAAIRLHPEVIAHVNVIVEPEEQQGNAG